MCEWDQWEHIKPITDERLAEGGAGFTVPARIAEIEAARAARIERERQERLQAQRPAVPAGEDHQDLP